LAFFSGILRTALTQKHRLPVVSKNIGMLSKRRLTAKGFIMGMQGAWRTIPKLLVTERPDIGCRGAPANTNNMGMHGVKFPARLCLASWHVGCSIPFT
jgi:hypothetical protein